LDRIWLAAQRGLGGEIEEFVDESHFAWDPGFDQHAMAASDHAHMRITSKPLIVAYAVFIDWKPLVGRISRLSAP
jgi:hypothetical protein